jgi:16S rRNA (adenine1518-N6/adenine1519-N6)-dimethyltransferase
VKHIARKRFGQHFLTDGAVIDDIVDAIAPKPGQALVEIGPGLGAMTNPLVARCTRLTVIELDRDLAARLRKRPELDVIESDVLKVDFGALATQFGAKLRVVGNLPYNISTPLLFHLARYAERVRDMHFMLQLEVVERMVAAHSTPAYGRLSVALQARFRMKKLFNVGKGAFRPPPKVESAIVRLEPLPEILHIDEDLLRRAFSARRKTLRNALPGADFAAAGIDPTLRPENLSPADYARLSMNSIL